MKILFAAFLLFTMQSAAYASAPQVKKQAPAFYRFMVGDIEVTTLLDGVFMMEPLKYLKDIKPDQATKLLEQSHFGTTVPTSVNAFLINTGSKLVLIDTGVGTGKGMGPGFNNLSENLKASGYKPEQIDEIYTTHMHGDHIGGLTTDGKANFTNAILRSDKHDVDFWLNAEEGAKATDPRLKSTIEGAIAAYAPYQKANKFKPFDGETELVPGVHAHPAYGHTPGHTIYTIESKGKKLWLMGDSIHVQAVQFPAPTATMGFDSDSKLAFAERKKSFAAIAKAGDMIGAAHLSFPGVGYIKAVGTGYAYSPLAYGAVE